MPSVHAVLSASAAHRWMLCTPSARLEERLKGQLGESTSVFAEEGTKAHALAELKLLRLKGSYGDRDGINEFNYNARREALGEISREMEEATDLYRDIIEEKYLTERGADESAKLLVEQRLDLSPWIPEGFGTGDAIIISSAMLEVCDLKYGKGVPVSAEGNPQTRCYGLGAVHMFGRLWDFDTVRVTIIQPRLDSVTEETLPRAELLDWGANSLKPKAELAWRGKGEYTPGEHCRFCAAKAVCSARVAKSMELFRFDAKPGLIPDESIPELLRVVDIAEDWIRDFRAYALAQAIHGQEWRGYKLVRGRKPPRRWTDEERVREQLIRAGYTPDTFEDVKLKSASQVEKLIGKSAFGAMFSELTVQEEGGLNLVPEADKRPGIAPADTVFADIIDSNE